jgi:localization factor PodJL
MNKAVPWSVKGVGSEAREAAREAARRSGLSVGEWLNGVIAEQAAEMGVSPEEIDDQGRLEAVTARLAELSRRLPESDMRRRRGDEGRSPVFSDQDGAEEDETVPTLRRSARRWDAKEAHFAKPVERRPAAGDRPTDAPADFSARSGERAAEDNALEETKTALDRMGGRLSEIERQLTNRQWENADPVRRTLANLEERLEGFGRGEQKEGWDAMLRQFDRKLSDFARQIGGRRSEETSTMAAELGRLQARIEELASKAAAAAPSRQTPDEPSEADDEFVSAPAPRLKDRAARQDLDANSTPGLRAGLDRAIADIARRQQALEARSSRVQTEQTEKEAGDFERRPPLRSSVGEPPRLGGPAEWSSHGRPSLPGPTASGGPRRQSADPDLALLRREIAHISRSLSELAPKAEVGSLASAVRDLDGRVERLGGDRADSAALAPLETLVADLRRANSEAPPAQTMEALRREVSAIGAKIDAVPVKSLDADLVRRLLGQTQEIRDLLASNLDRQAPLSNLERRLEDVGERLDRLSENALGRESLSEVLAVIEEVRASLGRSGSDGLLRAMDSRFAALSRKLDESPVGVDALGKVVELDRRLDGIRRELSEKFDLRAQNEARLFESLKEEINAKFEIPAPGPDLRRLEALLHDVADRFDAPTSAEETSAIQTAIRDMDAKLERMADRSIVDADALHQAVFEITHSLERPNSFQALQSERLEALLRDVGAKLSEPAASPSLRKMEELVGALAERIDEMSQRSEAPIEAVSALARQVGRLAEHMEGLRQPEVGGQALDALAVQIGELSARLENSDAGLRAIAQMETSLDGLFTSLSDTHQSAVDAAREAAREIAADMIGPDGRQNLSAFDRDLAELREAQTVAERRVHHTLTVVHDTLERVVDRLAAVEKDASRERTDTDLAASISRSESLASGPAPVFSRSSREGKSAQPDGAGAEKARRLEPAGSLASVRPQAASFEQDELIEPGSGFAPARRRDSDPGSPEPRSEQSAFIAAARRAIKLGGADSGTAGSADDGDIGDAKARARAAAARLEAAEIEKPSKAWLQRARKYVDSRKRPLLYGFAAVVLALCSLQVVSALLDKANSPASGSKPAVHAPTPAAPAQRRGTQGSAHGQSGSLDVQGDGGLASVAPLSAPAKPTNTGAASLAPSPTLMDLPTFAATPSLLPPDVVALRTAALRGDPGAQYALADRYAQGTGVVQNPTLAAQWFLRAARQNVALAAYRLGLIYEKGIGEPRDLKSAMDWYRQAALAGNVRAMHNLAVLSAQGGANDGPDYATAASWFQKAAQYGVRDSQYNLAILYARGLGIERNLGQAYKWFAVAAAQGDPDAGQKRDDVGARLDPSQIAQAKADAASFRPLAQVAAANAAPPVGRGLDATAQAGDSSSR